MAAVAGLVVVASASADDPKPKRKSRIDMPTLVDLHNKARAKEKLGPLTVNEKLVAAAKVQAKYMGDIGEMTHEGPEGTDSVKRVKDEDYKFQTLGENVAMGQKSSEEVMRMWMESPHHRDNIMKPEFTEIGVACYVTDEGVSYWCAVLGRPWPTVDPTKDVEAMLAALNASRTEEKKSPLKLNGKLTASAQKHAVAMSEALKFLEKDPDGKTPTERAQREGYVAKRIAQNDAIGQGDPVKVVKRWLDSDDGSRDVLLGATYQDVGIGVAADKAGVPYWCVIIGEKKAASRR